MKLRHFFVVLSVPFGLGILVSCGSAGKPQDVTETRQVTVPETVTMTSAERFGYAKATDEKTHMPPSKAHETVQPEATSSFTFELPTGWEQVQGNSMRLLNFHITAHAGVECYVSQLKGAAGGVLANVNRWRSQMGQSELTEEAVTKLPTIEMMGQQAVWAEIMGDYTDMQGKVSKGCLMLAAVAALPERTVFVKMVGPEAEVQAEKEHFIALCRSLKEK